MPIITNGTDNPIDHQVFILSSDKCFALASSKASLASSSEATTSSKPASHTALLNFSGSVRAASNSTVAVFAAKLTLAFFTPG